MAVLPIRTYPDPVLRVRCQEVEEFDDELARLVHDMVETMHDAPGIGLAASQVGVEKRVCVVDLSVGEDREELLVLVNPVIHSPEGSDAELEGCLSLPGISEKVVRPNQIQVKAQDLSGREFELEAEEWLARVICHETDHLNGVLFVDHLRGLRRERAKRQLRKLTQQDQESWAKSAAV